MHIVFKSSESGFCGCEHNLQPCPIIKQLLSGINQRSMRNQYNNLQRQNRFKSRFQLRKQYFRFLPSYYPELYHAQLSNILTNIQESITLNQFITLAWIQYHAKYEHITYFLFLDMSKCKQPKKKFVDSLELQLISQEEDLNSIIVESKSLNLNLVNFVEEYHQSFAANVIPLSQYGKFIKILLKQGKKSLKQLLALLLTSKRQITFWLLKEYNSMDVFRELCRQLDWQQILAAISRNE